MHRLLEREDELLRIQQRRFGVMRLLVPGLEIGWRSFLPQAQVLAGRFRKLRAQRCPDRRAQAVLPLVDAFQKRSLALGTRRAAAELVRLGELFEESRWVLDAVDAEFQRIHVHRADLHAHLAARAERARGEERKVRLALALAQTRGGHTQKQQKPCEAARAHPTVHCNPSFKMFHRDTPRKLGLPATGLHRGCGKFSNSSTVSRRISPGSDPFGPVWYRI